MTRPNPRYVLSEDFAELAAVFARQPVISLDLHWAGGRARVTIGGRGHSPIGIRVLPIARRIEISVRSFPLDPTTTFVLRELADAMAPWRSYELGFEQHWTEVAGARPGASVFTSYEMTLSEFRDALRVVEREASVYSGPYDSREASRAIYRFDAYTLPEEEVWYHATLLAYVPSIMREGLAPSSLARERVEGISPGFNIYLQRAVYLTLYREDAEDFAVSLALREGTDAAVLEVAPGAIEMPEFLVVDEDALYDERAGQGPTSGPHDADFPDYYVSLRRFGRLGYAGALAARYLSLVSEASVEDWEEVEPFSRQYRTASLHRLDDPAAEVSASTVRLD